MVEPSESHKVRIYCQPTITKILDYLTTTVTYLLARLSLIRMQAGLSTVIVTSVKGIAYQIDL
jgi:hypothetical protein